MNPLEAKVRQILEDAFFDRTAGLAMQATVWNHKTGDRYDLLAAECFKVADAMIAEGAK